MKKIFLALYYVASILIISWLFLSWFDVVTHNTNFWEPDYTCYQSWNFFTLWGAIT